MMQAIAEKHDRTKLISMPNYDHLLYREDKREMNKYCEQTGAGLVPVRISVQELLLHKWQSRQT